LVDTTSSTVDSSDDRAYFACGATQRRMPGADIDSVPYGRLRRVGGAALTIRVAIGLLGAPSGWDGGGPRWSRFGMFASRAWLLADCISTASLAYETRPCGCFTRTTAVVLLYCMADPAG